MLLIIFIITLPTSRRKGRLPFARTSQPTTHSLQWRH